MREQFRGFYERTDEELSMLWQEATFVFDTNMLLNVYRYQEKTRKRFFEILEQLNERIWAPHQVISEYQNNRLEVISQQLKVYNEISKALKDAQALLVGLKYLQEKHSFININDIINAPVKALGKANDKLSADQRTDRQEFEKLKKFDIYQEKLTQLFQRRIGEPYKKDQLVDLYRQADKRFELQIPPGWKDKGKKTYDKYGDVILWFQLLNYARAHNKPIIFVTDDIKSDWFLSAQESNGHPRLRPELVQEMFVEASVLLHAYPGNEFIDQATEFLKLTPEPAISADAKEVTEQNINEFNQIKHRFLAAYSGYQVEIAVQNWLKSYFPKSQIIKEYQHTRGVPRLDFLMIAPDGIRTGVEVRYFTDSRPFRKVVVEQILNAAGKGQELDKLIVFIITSDLPNVVRILEILENKFVIPANVSIIVGHIGPDDQFFYVATLPNET